ncbi:MAG: replication initiator protein A [Geobacteraceae bacterium]|nr:replication initiator protein A [Geobacteraceae bacterium]
MEHPFFSLTNRKDTRPREYSNNDGSVTVRVNPSHYGMPTIKDKDLLIYSGTLIRAAMNRGNLGPENTPVRIEVWNFLRATQRGDGAQQYKDLLNCLRRLYGAWVETDIITDNQRTTEPFRLLDDFKLISSTKTGKISTLQVKLCDWQYRALWNAKAEMLSINSKYFALSNLERRIYELARKHCGKQPFWTVGIGPLWKKSGSTGSVKEFRRKLRTMVVKTGLGTIPDYRMQFKVDEDKIIFYSANHKFAVETIIIANNPRRKRKM